MELQLLEKTKDSMNVQVRDADLTLIQPLISQLLTDEDVAEVKYITGHPELDIPVLYVKVKTGKPHAALKRAAKAISNEYKKAKEDLEKLK